MANYWFCSRTQGGEVMSNGLGLLHSDRSTDFGRGILLHEWLEPFGGAENVFEEICRTFPEAARLCLWNDAPKRFGKVRETWLARTPLRRHKAIAIPFMLGAWRHLGEADADWILVSTHLFAHHAHFNGSAKFARKFAYVHSPARYIWAPDLDRRGSGLGKRALARPLMSIDKKRATEIDFAAANSKFVAERIASTWDIESSVIYPPVRSRQFGSVSFHPRAGDDAFLESAPADFLIAASRLTPYKGIDLVLEMGAAVGLPVIVCGDGPDYDRLKDLAQNLAIPVIFVREPSDYLLANLLKRARALIFPAIEDFGILPVEAMATGTPVIGSNMGGVSETVVHGKTGILLDDWSLSGMREAILAAERIEAMDCVARAMEFDAGVFESRIRAWVGGNL